MKRNSFDSPLVVALSFAAVAAFVDCRLLAAASPAAATVESQLIPTQIPGHNALLMGADWYPEQWPESRWETDVKLMKEAHFTVVRIAEFAWSSMEPTEGHYDFGWLDRAIRLFEKYQIAVVLGTPTATPPAWLTGKYPETLRVEPSGQRVTHGNRAHGSPTSPKYLALCRQIAEVMAKRYGHDPAVVGWQFDNEYGYGQMSYDEGTRKQFQDFVQSRYKTTAAVNEHWATAYWSQTYDNWAEIPIPVGGHNPGLMMEWKRFVTFAWTAYQQNQIDVIRASADPRQFITGNFMGMGFDAFDHYKITEPLTFVAWDAYVGSGHLDPVSMGMSHDTMRGLKRQNFWEIETQPGSVNWAGVNNFLDRGEIRAMAWHAVGHGADEVSYWQWRNAANGQEQYHGALIGADGTPLPVFAEIAQTAKEFADTEAAFRGTAIRSEVAILNDYESRWAIDWQKHNNQWSSLGTSTPYYGALKKRAQSVDVVSPYAPLAGYKLVVAPGLNLIPESLAQHLLEYVKGGGHLVLGPRAGMKDEYNALLPQRQPGFLVPALGGRVAQYYALEKKFPVSGALGTGEVGVWAELLEASAADAEVLLRFGTSNGWLDGQPAAITRPAGKGRITYLGGVFDDKIVSGAADWMIAKSGVAPAFGPAPDGVEVNRRVAPGKRLYVLINFKAEGQKVSLPRPMKSLLEGKDVEAVDLGRFGVAVLLDSKPN
jgi:beta-galactosidase